MNARPTPTAAGASSPAPTVAGLLLTGGASRRMGRDKATMRRDGRTLADRLAALLEAVTAPAIEVGPGRSALPAVCEVPAGAGPLAALAAGWAALVARGVTGPAVVLACDLPALREGVVRALARWPGEGGVVPVVDGRPQPLCARFGAAALDACAGLLADGHHSVRPLLERPDVLLLGPERWSGFATAADFADADTPADAVRLGVSVGRVGPVGPVGA